MADTESDQQISDLLRAIPGDDDRGLEGSQPPDRRDVGCDWEARYCLRMAGAQCDDWIRLLAFFPEGSKLGRTARKTRIRTPDQFPAGKISELARAVVDT